jgi:acetyl esterase
MPRPFPLDLPLLAFVVCVFFSTGAFAQTKPTDLTALPSESHTYRKVGGQELKLWVFKPIDWKAGDQRPAIVFFHGGGWIGGTPKQLAPQCHHLASRGLVAITVQYRFINRAKEANPDICVQDARAALRWVAAHAKELGIDPARLGAGGGSAGGHLAACTVLDASYDDPSEPAAAAFHPKALILFNPAVNLVDVASTTDANRALRRRLSPLFHITAAHPPTLIMVGEKDTTTPPEQDRVYIAKLTELGIRAELKVYPGQTHVFFNYRPAGNPWYDATVADMDRFLTSLGWIKPPARK